MNSVHVRRFLLRRKYVTGFCLAAVVVLVGISPWMKDYATVAIVARDTFPEGLQSNVRRALHDDNAKRLTAIPPQRLKSILRLTPSSRMCTVILLALKNPRQFPADADWTGVAPLVASIAFFESDPNLTVHARAALLPLLDQAPAIADQDRWRELFTRATKNADRAEVREGLSLLVHLLLKLDPNSADNIRQQLEPVLNHSQVEARLTGLTILAAHFPQDPELLPLSKSLIAWPDLTTRQKLQLRSVILDYSNEFQALLAEPQNAELLFQIFQGTVQRPGESPNESNPLLEAAKQRAEEVLLADEAAAHAAAAKFLAIHDPQRLLRLAATGKAPAQTEILKQLVFPWTLESLTASQLEPHAEALCQLMFDDKVPTAQRSAIARILLPRMVERPNLGSNQRTVEPFPDGVGPRASKWRSQYWKLLKNGVLRSIAEVYFLHCQQLTTEDLPQLKEIVEAGRSRPNQQLVLGFIEHYGNDPRVLDLAWQIVEVGNVWDRAPFYTQLLRLESPENYSKVVAHLVEKSDEGAQSRVAKDLLADPRLAPVLKDPKLSHIVKAIVLDLPGDEFAKLCDLFSDEHVYQLARDRLRWRFNTSQGSTLPQYVPVRSEIALLRKALHDVVIELLKQPDPQPAQNATQLLATLAEPPEWIADVIVTGLQYPDLVVIHNLLTVAEKFHIDDENVILQISQLVTDSSNEAILLSGLRVWKNLRPQDPNLRTAAKRLMDHESKLVRLAASKIVDE